MLSERCDLDDCLGWVCEFHSLRKEAQEYIAKLEACVEAAREVEAYWREEREFFLMHMNDLEKALNELKEE